MENSDIRRITDDAVGVVDRLGLRAALGDDMPLQAADVGCRPDHRRGGVGLDGDAQAAPCFVVAWEKQVLSARGFKRVGRHSEYAI